MLKNKVKETLKRIIIVGLSIFSVQASEKYNTSNVFSSNYSLRSLGFNGSSSSSSSSSNSILNNLAIINSFNQSNLMSDSSSSSSTSNQSSKNKKANFKELILAIKKLNLEGVRKVISAGVDINAMDEKGNTPVMYVVGDNNPKPRQAILDLLIENGANLNCKNSKGDSLLKLIIKKSSLDIFNKVASTNNININVADSDGMTLLMHATKDGKSGFIKHILTYNADENLIDKFGYKAIDFNDGNDSRLNGIIKRQLIKTKSFDKKALLGLYKNLNEKNIYQALFLAMKLKCEDILEKIVENNFDIIDIDIRNNAGYSILEYAIKCNIDPNIFRMLYEKIKKSKKIQVYLDDGVKCVIKNNVNTELMKILIGNGAKYKNINLLSLAAENNIEADENNNFEAVRYLLEIGLENEICAAASKAVEIKYFDLIEFLFNYWGKKTQVSEYLLKEFRTLDDRGNKKLDLFKEQPTKIVKFFLENCEFTQKEKNEVFCKNLYDIERVELLLNNGADIDTIITIGNNTKSVLAYVCSNIIKDKIGIIKLLLKRGADMSVLLDSNGQVNTQMISGDGLTNATIILLINNLVKHYKEYEKDKAACFKEIQSVELRDTTGLLEDIQGLIFEYRDISLYEWVEKIYPDDIKEKVKSKTNQKRKSDQTKNRPSKRQKKSDNDEFDEELDG